jgi:hypothetical protein
MPAHHRDRSAAAAIFANGTYFLDNPRTYEKDPLHTVNVDYTWSPPYPQIIHSSVSSKFFGNGLNNQVLVKYKEYGFAVTPPPQPPTATSHAAPVQCTALMFLSFQNVNFYTVLAQDPV